MDRKTLGLSSSMSVDTLLQVAAEKTGWDQSSIIDVMTDYIENQQSNGTFADFLAERVSDETDA